MSQTKLADLIGLSEIAELYGVDTNTANGWRRRNDFPKPVHQLRMGPMWDKSQVLAWRKPRPDHRISLTLPCSTCGSPLLNRPERVDQKGDTILLRFWCTCGQDTDLIIMTMNDGTHVVSEGWEPTRD